MKFAGWLRGTLDADEMKRIKGAHWYTKLFLRAARRELLLIEWLGIPIPERSTPLTQRQLVIRCTMLWAGLAVVLAAEIYWVIHSN
jgi:hypothetical protein